MQPSGGSKGQETAAAVSRFYLLPFHGWRDRPQCPPPGRGDGASQGMGRGARQAIRMQAWNCPGCGLCGKCWKTFHGAGLWALQGSPLLWVRGHCSDHGPGAVFTCTRTDLDAEVGSAGCAVAWPTWPRRGDPPGLR